MAASNRPFSILHIILVLKPTNGQYNEHCLPLRDKRDIAICTYFKSSIAPPPEITLFDGDDSLRGFQRALTAALQAREYDVIHVHTPHAGVLLLMTLLLTGQYRRLIGSSVHTVQNSFQNFTLRNQLLFLPSFLCFRRLVFCSHAADASFPAFFKWLGRGRMSVVQNCVDLARIDRVASAARSAPTSSFTIATVGLIDMKNPFTVLKAFRACDARGSRLVYIGDGHLRPALEREVETAGLQGEVETPGLIERDRVFERFVEADLFVSASWGEGLPVAVLEAMACRRPVVLSDIPPHRELAEGVDFIPLVPPGDAQGFAREIARFRELSAPDRAAIGQKCRALIEERFGLRTMHAEYAKLYSEITGGRVPALPAESHGRA